MKKIFTHHPNSVGETYIEHFVYAAQFGFTMLFSGIACLIHAIFPFMFKKTGSNLLFKMLHRFMERAPASEHRIIQLSKVIKKKLHKANSA